MSSFRSTDLHHLALTVLICFLQCSLIPGVGKCDMGTSLKVEHAAVTWSQYLDQPWVCISCYLLQKASLIKTEVCTSQKIWQHIYLVKWKCLRAPQQWMLDKIHSSRHAFPPLQWAQSQSETKWLPCNSCSTIISVSVLCLATWYCSLQSPKRVNTISDFLYSPNCCLSNYWHHNGLPAVRKLLVSSMASLYSTMKVCGCHQQKGSLTPTSDGLVGAMAITCII